MHLKSVIISVSIPCTYSNATFGIGSRSGFRSASGLESITGFDSKFEPAQNQIELELELIPKKSSMSEFGFKSSAGIKTSLVETALDHRLSGMAIVWRQHPQREKASGVSSRVVDSNQPSNYAFRNKSNPWN